jgi:glycosyltransferase involved in cell wall biosynthesis
MRIAFDVSYIQKRRAGIGRHALQLLKTLLSSDKRNEYVLHGWSHGLDIEEITKLRSENVELSIVRIPGDVKRFYWNRLRVPSIERFVGRVQVFHSTDPMLPSVKHAKKICTVHDLAYKMFPAMFERRVLAWDSCVERSIRSADAIIVPSEQTKNDLVESRMAGDETIHVLRLPPDSLFREQRNMDVDKFTLTRLQLTKPFILFVGTIEPRKNIVRIIKAFEEVRQTSHPDVDLVIAGKKGWLYHETFQAIVGSREKSRIHYLSFVADDQLAVLYREAVCFVYPSLYEGYGFPLLEAMASGTPIVTSLNSSMRELADGVALLVDPSSTGDIAEAMHLLIGNEVRRVEMKQRGLQVVDHFRSDAAAQKVLSLYDMLAA